LTNAVLLGTLLVPLGLISPSGRHSGSRGSEAEDESALPPQLGTLPLARRDLERLQQILGLQRRLRETGASVRSSFRAIQQPFDLGNRFRRRLAGAERLHHQRSDGPAIDLLNQFAPQLPQSLQL
jgi:hypothetical protein